MTERKCNGSSIRGSVNLEQRNELSRSANSRHAKYTDFLKIHDYLISGGAAAAAPLSGTTARVREGGGPGRTRCGLVLLVQAAAQVTYCGGGKPKELPPGENHLILLLVKYS